MSKFNLDKLREIAEPRKLSRAEEMALKAYPRDEDRELNFRRTNYRIAYERGYKQAEKDLALTWEDVQLLHIVTEKYLRELDKRIEVFPSSSQEVFEEVITRFKQFKETKDGNDTINP